MIIGQKIFSIEDTHEKGNWYNAENTTKHEYIFAGAPTDEYTGAIESAIERLKAAVSPYKALVHSALIRFIEAEEMGGGFAIVFDWVDAVCAHRMYPLDHQKFKQIPHYHF